jgi:hypothetical protein
MMNLSVGIAALAIVVQFLDMAGFAFSNDRQHFSSSFVVPILLWYIALALREHGFIFRERSIELAVVLALHLIWLWIVRTTQQKTKRK